MPAEVVVPLCLEWQPEILITRWTLLEGDVDPATVSKR